MKNVIEFPDTASIRQEAIDWLIRLDAEAALPPKEHARLGEWLRRSPVHRQQLKEVADRWRRMNVLTDLAVPLGQLKHTVRGNPGGTSRRIVGLAAAAATIVFGITLGYMRFLDPQSVVDTNGYYTTAIGEQKTASLSDGSIALLNTNTRIRVQYSEKFRDIHLLQGEAHFTVVEDAHKKFRVFARGGRIDAIGTAFSVYIKETSVEVTVTDGLVALGAVLASDAHAGSAGEVGALEVASTELAIQSLGTLAAGEVATILDLSESASSVVSLVNIRRDVDEQDLSRRLSWTEGSIVFSGAPLAEVVKEISRYTVVKIDFSEPSLRSIPVGGSFPVGETDAMFKMLEISFGLDVSYLSDTHVLISAASD